MVRIVVYLNPELKQKIDAQRGTTPRSKMIAKAMQWLADQNYLQNI
jgi:metal-responsive CopG/Arc/MetJ family transcriptional regulator